MALTQDICKTSLKEGMRAVPRVGANVDLPEVDSNFAGLGAGVLNLLAHADTVSAPASDTTFWQWVTAVTNWLGELHAWESGVNKAIDDWTPATPSETALRTALQGVPRPPAPPTPAPAQLKGKVV
jgi:hypothetical protein